MPDALSLSLLTTLGFCKSPSEANASAAIHFLIITVREFSPSPKIGAEEVGGVSRWVKLAEWTLPPTLEISYEVSPEYVELVMDIQCSHRAFKFAQRGNLLPFFCHQVKSFTVAHDRNIIVAEELARNQIDLIVQESDWGRKSRVIHIRQLPDLHGPDIQDVGLFRHIIFRVCDASAKKVFVHSQLQACAVTCSFSFR